MNTLTLTLLNVPMLTWSVIIGTFVFIIIIRMLFAICRLYKSKGSGKMITIGRECEEFYAPGDDPTYDVNDSDLNASPDYDEYEGK